jgi:hypothetical protein
MNKRTVMASLNKIANELDKNGLHNEADTVTKVMSRLAYDDFDVRDYDSDESMSGMDMGYCPECQELSLIDGHCEQCGYGEDDEDYDMGPEKEPFDYNSPEDEGDMYGDDMKGYMDKDSDF